MMKLQLVVLTALVAFASADNHLPKFGEGPLYEDIVYFTDMIPMEKVMGIVTQYLLKDNEFRDLVKHVSSDEFKQMLNKIENIPEFHMFADYMEHNGVYMYDILNKVNKLAGLPSFHSAALGQTITGGLKGLFNDIKALVNYDDIIHGYVYKMRTSDAFRDFVRMLRSEYHQKFVNTLYSMEDFLTFRQYIVSRGLDMTLFEDVSFIVLGINYPTMSRSLYANSLSKDFQDFANLIDMKKIIGIAMSYMDDDQVQQALEYMYSEEFHELVRKVEALEAYQHGVQYLIDAGVDMVSVLNKIHQIFGMEPYAPMRIAGFINTFANRGGMKGLLDAVIAALPMDQFRALYKEKMATSPDFKDFVEHIQSDEFQEVVDMIYAEPLFLEMRAKAAAVGLDLDVGRRIFEEIGIKLPRPSGF